MKRISFLYFDPSTEMLSLLSNSFTQLTELYSIPSAVTLQSMSEWGRVMRPAPSPNSQSNLASFCSAFLEDKYYLHHNGLHMCMSATNHISVSWKSALMVVGRHLLNQHPMIKSYLCFYTQWQFKVLHISVKTWDSYYKIISNQNNDMTDHMILNFASMCFTVCTTMTICP